MKPTIEILTRLQENSKNNHDEVFTKLFRYLLRPDIYYTAFQNLYANNGAGTKCVDNDTADGFSEDKVNQIIEALKNGDEDIAMMNRQYAERRKLVLERINGIKGLSCTPPNGAFYAFVNIKETGMTSVEFCEKLLEKEGVVTAPGSAFGEQGEGYVRLSYATSMEQINRGMDRIQRFMESIM